MSLKSEMLAFVFGILLVLVTFGDDHLPDIGNLDTIFGLRFWPLMDVIYPLASILVFILYGHEKGEGNMKTSTLTVLAFLSYIVVLILVTLDDFIDVLNLNITLPGTYWITIMWLYPIYSSIVLFIFGKANQT
jgi:hypothetical protein